MIETLEITNFKSVKHMTLPCKRFNVFIGEPNTGKSNILEALGLLSFIGAWKYQPGIKLDGFVRHERTSNLFYDEEVGEPLSVRCDDAALVLAYRDGCYRGEYTSAGETAAAISGDRRTITEVDCSREETLAPVRFYRSPATGNFRPSSCEYLLPPNGSNLPSLLMRNAELRHTINLPYKALGLRLEAGSQENKIEVVRKSDGATISYPYSQTSETLQRHSFYIAAIDSNRAAVLVFEEPESHTFSPDAVFLAEVIARDDDENQYFITTHSPDFLMTLLCKAPRDDLAINIVHHDDYLTKVKQLSPEDLPELFELDVFSNLERYLKPWLYT